MSDAEKVKRGGRRTAEGGEGAEEDIKDAAAWALVEHDRLEVRMGIAPLDLTWN